MTNAITIEAAEARAEYRSNAGIVLDGRDADLEALAAALLFNAEAEAFNPDNRGTHASEAANSWRAFEAGDAIQREAIESAPDAEVVDVMTDVYVHHRISFKDGWKRAEPRLANVVRMWIDIDGYGRPFISATRGQRPLSGKPIAARVRGWRKLMQPEQSIDDRAEALARIWRSIGR